MSTLLCHTTIDELSKAQSIEELHAICARACEKLGFDYFLYAARMPTSFVKPFLTVISGFPASWWEHYKKQNYMHIDPALAYCAVNNTPLDWSRLRPEEQQDRLVRNFMDEARDFGLHNGVSFPVHGAQGEAALWSLALDRQPADAATRIREAMPYAHFLAVHLHEAVRRIIQIKEILPAAPNLTPREKECLLWAAEGKTSWETSQILGISERTVIFHLQNAGTKLETTTRQQTVARAISTGQLTPQLS